MSNVTIVRISGGPESLYANVGPAQDRAPSPGAESSDASTVTFTNGRVTLRVDGSGSPGLPRRPQRTRRRTQLVHHRDRHLRQEVKVVRYLPSPKAAPQPHRRSSTSDAATSTSASDADDTVDASPAPLSAASSSSERSSGGSRVSGGVSGGVSSGVSGPPSRLRYRLSLAEQYQNQLFTEPDYVISAPAAFAGDWAASSDAHDSGLEGSESDAAPRSEHSGHTKAPARDHGRELTQPCDVTDRASERGAASEHSQSRVELTDELCRGTEEGSEYCISAAEESGFCCATTTTEQSSELYVATSEESGYCYIPAKEQRECSQEVLIVVSERVSPADLAASLEDLEEDADPEESAASRKISAATTVDKHFYFGEETDVVESEGSTGQIEFSTPEEREISLLTVQNLRRLEELQSRSALPESFLAFKQALLESGDMSGLRKADLYTVLGGTVRGYPASWDNLGSKFEEPDSRSDDPQAADTDSRSGVSIDAWTVDRRGRYRAVAARPGSSRRAAVDALATISSDSDGWYPLCVRCEDMVYPQDGVRPTPDAVYHVACLRCATCERGLGKEEVCTAGRLVFCGLHAPPGASFCQQGSRQGSCASSTDGAQVSTAGRGQLTGQIGTGHSVGYSGMVVTGECGPFYPCPTPGSVLQFWVYPLLVYLA